MSNGIKWMQRVDGKGLMHIFCGDKSACRQVSLPHRCKWRNVDFKSSRACWNCQCTKEGSMMRKVSLGGQG